MAAADVLQGQLFTSHGRPERKAAPAAPSTPAPAPGPGQLPMFMSAREIMSSHTVNEPDRLFHGTNISVGRASGVRLNGGPDPRAGEWTGRDARTDGVVNNFVADPRGNYHPQRPTGVDLKGEWAKPETDEQMYERKRQESLRTPSAGGMARSRRDVKGKSLHESIEREGVQMPVALGHEEGTGRPDFIAGGHHRLAVMAHLNPDQLLPVTHVRSVSEAHDVEREVTTNAKVRSATAKEKRNAQGNFVQRQQVHEPTPQPESRFG